MLNVFITNLGKYNEGDLVGEWVKLPVSDEELTEVYSRIGINKYYEEIFITDYDTDVSGITVNEYDNISDLNELADTLESMNEYDLEVISALIGEGYTLTEALDMKDDTIVYPDCHDMEDVARVYVEECGVLDQMPDHLQMYFDFKAYGRDMGCEGQYIFTDKGNCIQVIY